VSRHRITPNIRKRRAAEAVHPASATQWNQKGSADLARDPPAAPLRVEMHLHHSYKAACQQSTDQCTGGTTPMDTRVSQRSAPRKTYVHVLPARSQINIARADSDRHHDVKPTSGTPPNPQHAPPHIPSSLPPFLQLLVPPYNPQQHNRCRRQQRQYEQGVHQRAKQQSHDEAEAGHDGPPADRAATAATAPKQREDHTEKMRLASARDAACSSRTSSGRLVRA